MFKIIPLDGDAAAALDTLQQSYDITAVTVLGRDTEFAVYLLVQYATKLPASAQSADAGKKAAK